MRNRLCLVTAAALAVGGVGFVSHGLAQDYGQPQDRPGVTGQQPGIGVDRDTQRVGVDRMQKQQIKSFIARVTDAALSEEGLNRVIQQHVTREDRQRLGEIERDDQTRQIVQQLRQEWRQRYDEDFSIGQEELAFDDQNFRIIPGDVGDRARPAGERVPPTDPGMPGQPGAPGHQPGQPGQPGAPGHQPGQPGMPGHQPGVGEPGQPGIGVDRERHEDRATVIMPEAHGAPTVLLNLVREDGQWKLDLPTTVDADRLQQNLQQSLQQITQQREQWPKDEDEAYVFVAHHVLAGLTDAQRDADRLRPDLDRPGMPEQPGMDRPGIDPGDRPGMDPGDQPGLPGQQPQQPR